MTIRQWHMIQTVKGIICSMIDSWGRATGHRWLHSRYQGQGGRARGRHSLSAWPDHPGGHPHTASWPRAWCHHSHHNVLLLATHHAVGVVSTGPGTGISAVSGPAGVPVRAVQIMVAVAGAETRALGAAYRVTIPRSRKGVELDSFGLFLGVFSSQGSGVGGRVGFYCLYRSLISRLRTWGLSKCHKRFLLRQLLAAGRIRRHY